MDHWIINCFLLFYIDPFLLLICIYYLFLILLEYMPENGVAMYAPKQFILSKFKTS